MGENNLTETLSLRALAAGSEPTSGALPRRKILVAGAILALLKPLGMSAGALGREAQRLFAPAEAVAGHPLRQGRFRSTAAAGSTPALATRAARRFQAAELTSSPADLTGAPADNRQGGLR